ncbi:hypothetical protein EG68_03152 [Paragonimus skrjabini miyazakii]|uniref:Sodium-coupled monocarboxylate transporter 1 n=1 Tax=Paragonimus skrjabini miyazakii TaxID=59628 RepID=A0A8S9Z231_9TREM|nr:hypothetical protein EG68_03152 [Paragonimus skrjabini miyazakii]
MAFTFHWSDYLIFALLLVVYALIGIYQRFHDPIVRKLNRLCCNEKWKLKEHSLSDNTAEALTLGNRQLTLFPIMSSVMASFLSAVSLMGTASEAYLYGIQFVLMIVAYTIGFSVTAELFIPVFYKLHLVSAHEYLELRFGQSVRWTTSVVYCVQMGGIRAVIWTDVVQLFILTTGLLLVVSVGVVKVGGMEKLLKVAQEGLRIQSFDADPNPFKRHTIWTLMIGGAGMVLSIYATNQTQVQRYLACRDLRTARLSILLNIPLNALFLIVQLMAGLVSYVYFVGCDPISSGSVSKSDQILPYIVMVLFDGIPVIRGLFLSVIFAAAIRSILLNIPLNALFLIVQLMSGLVSYVYFVGCDPISSGSVSKSDQILPYIVMVLFDGIPVIRGLFLSVIFAAAISTVSSGINSLATVLLEDIIQPFLLFVRKREICGRTKNILTVLLSIIVGLCTISMSFVFMKMGPRVLQFAFSLFGAVGGPILAVFTLGMVIPCVNWQGALAGLLCSLAIGLGLTVGGILHPIPINTMPLSTQNCTTEFNSSLVVNLKGADQQWNIFSLSYLYYTLVCVCAAILVAIPTSAIFNFNSKHLVSGQLLAWQTRAFYRRLPSCFPKQWEEKACRQPRDRDADATANFHVNRTPKRGDHTDAYQLGED